MNEKIKMKFVKKNIKLIIGIIVGTLLVSGISVYATYIYFANEIKYTDDKSVADALNDLYSIKTENLSLKSQIEELQKKIEIVSYKGNVSNGTTINVEVGNYVFVSSPANSYATNSKTLISGLNGGSYNGIGTYTCVFEATASTMKITPQNNCNFSYIIVK